MTFDQKPTRTQEFLLFSLGFRESPCIFFWWEYCLLSTRPGMPGCVLTTSEGSVGIMGERQRTRQLSWRELRVKGRDTEVVAMNVPRRRYKWGSAWHNAENSVLMIAMTEKWNIYPVEFWVAIERPWEVGRLLIRKWTCFLLWWTTVTIRLELNESN